MGAGGMRVEVEEVTPLHSDEVMAGRGTPARDADALRHHQRGLERVPVHRRHAINAQSCP